MKILPPKGWKCKIVVGLCGQDGAPLSDSHYGHAHNYHKYSFGVICMQKLCYLGGYIKIKNKIKIIRPSHWLKHEYAHILTPNQMHTQLWLENLKKLKGHTKRYVDNWNYWKHDKGIKEDLNDQID